MITIEEEFLSFQRVARARGSNKDVKSWFAALMTLKGAKGKITKLGDGQAQAIVEIPR